MGKYFVFTAMFFMVLLNENSIFSQDLHRYNTVQVKYQELPANYTKWQKYGSEFLYSKIMEYYQVCVILDFQLKMIDPSYKRIIDFPDLGDLNNPNVSTIKIYEGLARDLSNRINSVPVLQRDTRLQLYSDAVDRLNFKVDSLEIAMLKCNVLLRPAAIYKERLELLNKFLADVRYFSDTTQIKLNETLKNRIFTLDLNVRDIGVYENRINELQTENTQLKVTVDTNRFHYSDLVKNERDEVRKYYDSAMFRSYNLISLSIDGRYNPLSAKFSKSQQSLSNDNIDNGFILEINGRPLFGFGDNLDLLAEYSNSNLTYLDKSNAQITDSLIWTNSRIGFGLSNRFDKVWKINNVDVGLKTGIGLAFNYYKFRSSDIETSGNWKDAFLKTEINFSSHNWFFPLDIYLGYSLSYKITGDVTGSYDKYTYTTTVANAGTFTKTTTPYTLSSLLSHTVSIGFRMNLLKIKI